MTKLDKKNIYIISSISGILVILLTLFISHRVEIYEKEQLHKLFTLQTKNLLKEMSINLEQYKLEIERMAYRKAEFKNLVKDEFLIDSKKHLEDHDDLNAIEWVDHDNIIQWRYPITESVSFAIGLDLSWDKKRYETIEKAAKTRSTLVSKLIDLIEGGKGFMLASPVYRGDYYKGSIVYLFRIDELFEKMLDDESFAVSIYEDDRLIYQMEKYKRSEGSSPTIQLFESFGAKWKIRLYPTQKYIEKNEKNTSFLINLFGFFFSVFVGSIVYLQLVKRNQSIKLHEAKERLQQFMDNQQSLVIQINMKTEQFSYANKPFLNFLGYDSIERFIGVNVSILDKFIQNDIYFHKGKISKGFNWIEAIRELPSENQVVCMMSKNFEPHAFQVHITDYSSSTYIINFTDISASMLKRIEFENKATSDKLTGLNNREYFNTHIDKYIKKSLEKDKYLGLIIYDIDKFKSVNDTYGHNRGDEVLKQMAKIAKDAIGKKDMLIRWGGEEFIVVKIVKSLDELEAFSEKLRTDIESSHFEEVNTVTSSFGITLYNLGERIVDTIERADEALYRAKKSGRNRVEIN